MSALPAHQEAVATAEAANHTSTSSWLINVILIFDKKKGSRAPVAAFDTLPQYDPVKTEFHSTSTASNVLYLAYGSNLCAATFQGNRGIKPLSATNVIVPELELVFNLPGIPYSEPCYANARFRSLNNLPECSEYFAGSPTDSELPYGHSEPEDNERTPKSLEHVLIAAGWGKGLVGVVYEVTPGDYAHLLSTEGGGYADVEVSCFPLPRGDGHVPDRLHGPSFKARTVIADRSGALQRRREGWSQPSVRYLGLLIAGAKEHGLPRDYQTWLANLQPYSLGGWRQKVGKTLFEAMWSPWVVMGILLERNSVDEKGRIPGWVNRLVGWLDLGMWLTHDLAFKYIAGDGERTSRQNESLDRCATH